MSIRACQELAEMHTFKYLGITKIGLVPLSKQTAHVQTIDSAELDRYLRLIR